MCGWKDTTRIVEITDLIEVAICANQGELCDCPRGTCTDEPDAQSLGSDSD